MLFRLKANDPCRDVRRAINKAGLAIALSLNVNVGVYVSKSVHPEYPKVVSFTFSNFRGPVINTRIGYSPIDK